MGHVGDVVAVSCRIGYSHTVAWFADIYPAMCADLVLCLVPAGVVMGCAPNMAKLSLICGTVCVHIYREQEFEQLLAFMPVDVVVYLQNGAAPLKPYGLNDS